jgi:hypothetical protein
LRLPMAPPRPPPPRAPAIASIRAVVSSMRRFPSVAGAMAVAWPRAARALSTTPSSPFSSSSYSPLHREAAALPRLRRTRWWSPFGRRPQRRRVLAASELPPIGCMIGRASGPTISHHAWF